MSFQGQTETWLGNCHYRLRYPSRSILCLCPIFIISFFLYLFIYLSLSSAVRVAYTITKTSNSISLKFLGHTKDWCMQI